MKKPPVDHDRRLFKTKAMPKHRPLTGKPATSASLRRRSAQADSSWFKSAIRREEEKDNRLYLNHGVRRLSAIAGTGDMSLSSLRGFIDYFAVRDRAWTE
ncbi:hypothetical protein ASE37_09820 [Rhizobium sp. Root268]|nr:hypothetical protein ASC86_09830 [Rhizobium sp. Root1212]KRD31145.1 hypothetical protein ASE37_09820 [Rhizobium sp. Root268]